MYICITHHSHTTQVLPHFPPAGWLSCLPWWNFHTSSFFWTSSRNKIKRGGIKKKQLNAKKIPKVNSNFLQAGRKQHFATERSRQLLSLGEDMWAVKYLPWQRVHESQQLPVSLDIEHANYPPKFRLDSCYLTPLSTQYGTHLAWNWFLFSHHKHWKWIGRLY